MNLFFTTTLPNGLVVEFYDDSNRYFGDYWRVSIEVRCRVPVKAAFFDENDPEFQRARTLIGEEVVYVRALKKMGVPGDEVSSVSRSLVENFLESTSSYFSDPSFVSKYIRKRLAERRGGTRPFLVPK